MNINMEKYSCSVCKKQNVKLWRPYGDDEPLICAECAEKRQSVREYDEMEWEVSENEEMEFLKGNPTKRKLKAPRWRVDSKGNIPECISPLPKGYKKPKTCQLLVDISDVSQRYQSGQTCLIPAYPSDEDFLSYQANIPSDINMWWISLPTR